MDRDLTDWLDGLPGDTVVEWTDLGVELAPGILGPFIDVLLIGGPQHLNWAWTIVAPAGREPDAAEHVIALEPTATIAAPAGELRPGWSVAAIDAALAQTVQAQGYDVTFRFIAPEAAFDETGLAQRGLGT